MTTTINGEEFQKLLKLIEIDDDFVTDQDITADGVQWAPTITSGGADAWTDVLSKKFDPGLTGNIQKHTFGLTARLKQLNTTTTLTWQWQGSNDGGTWVDLHPVVTEAANTITAGVERTMQGGKIVAGFNKVPHYVRLRFQTSEASQGQARVKSSSRNSYRFEAV